jgi:hypothetical protein
MTITTPATPEIIKAQTFLQPDADAEPLQTILENANAAYMLHRPPLIQCLYTTIDRIDRDCTLQIPVHPSADDLQYAFRHYLLPQTSSPNDDMTVQVEQWSSGGGWSTIYGPTTISATDNTRLVHTHDTVIDADALKLRITYTRANSGEYRPEGLLVYPNPTALVAGVKASGFVPFDDGLLSATGAGLNVEHHNRAKRNAHALLADRHQCAFSFVQEDDPTHVAHDIATPALDASVALRIAQGRAVLPGQSEPLLRVRCIASVSAGADNDLVLFRQVQGAQVELDADGTAAAPTEATLRLALAQPGTMGASALLQALGKRTAGNSMYLHALVAWWEVGQ